MRRSTRVAVGLVLLAVVAAAVVLVLRPRAGPAACNDSDGSSDEGARASGAPRSAEAGALAAQPSAGTDEGPESLLPASTPIDPKTTVTGRVLGPDGKPVARVVVNAYKNDPRTRGGPFPIWSSAVTDETGAFRLLQLREGRGWVKPWLVVEPREGTRATLVATELGATGVVVTLQPASAARVFVVDEDGVPIAFASVGASRRPSNDSAVQKVTATTEANGVATVEGIEVFGGSHPSLRVIPPVKRQRDLLTKIVPDWDLNDTTVRLEKSLTISGTVRNLAGQPVPHAKVWAKGTSRGVAENEDDADAQGRFQLTDVPRDTEYRLWARPAGQEFPGAAAESRVARAGDADVVLVVDAGAPLTVIIDDWPAGAIGRATLSRESDGPTPRGTVAVFDTGSLQFDGLDASATYTLWIPPPLGSDVCVLASGLRPGADGHRVQVQKARDIRVREQSSEPMLLRGFKATFGPFGVGLSLTEDESERTIRGVPDGVTLHVTAWGIFLPERKGVIAFGEADVPAGETTVSVPIVEKKLPP